MSTPFEITALKRQINTAADIIRDLTNQLGEERQNVVRLNVHIESLEKHNRSIEEALIAANDHATEPVVLPQPYYGDRHCLDKREVIAAIVASGGTVADDECSTPENDLGRKSMAMAVKLLHNQWIALEAEVIRDANRYRFLRDEDAWGEDSDSWDPDTRTGLISAANLLWLSGDHYDAAIDARMAASEIPFFNPVKSANTGDQS